MKYKEKKSSKFFEGKGFYLVLSGCLIAVGIASWSAYSGINNDEPNPDPAPSYTASENEPEPDDAPVGTETTSEPYSSLEESQYEEPSTPPVTEIVADKFNIALNGNITKNFSATELVYSETFRDMRLHTGIDISGELGTEVRSCGKGYVVAVINDALLGNYVEIDHGNGVVARYCGLDQNISVQEGDTVSLGTKLGTLGAIPSECSDKSHLHLEFFKDEIPVDPMSFING